MSDKGGPSGLFMARAVTVLELAAARAIRRTGAGRRRAATCARTAMPACSPPCWQPDWTRRPASWRSPAPGTTRRCCGMRTTHPNHRAEIRPGARFPRAMQHLQVTSAAACSRALLFATTDGVTGPWTATARGLRRRIACTLALRGSRNLPKPAMACCACARCICVRRGAIGRHHRVRDRLRNASGRGRVNRSACACRTSARACQNCWTRWRPPARDAAVDGGCIHDAQLVVEA